MAVAEVIGFVPAPPSFPNFGASDLFEGELAAYGASTVVTVVDTHASAVVGVLNPGPDGGAVTCLSWLPTYHTKSAHGRARPSHLSLASGDTLGRVLLWDVPAATHEVLLDELPGRRTELARSPGRGGVRDMTWVRSGSILLAVLLHPSTLLLINPQDGSQVWRREWHGTLLSCLTRDPLDHTHISICGDQDSILALRFLNPSADRVETKQYSVASGGSGGGKGPAEGGPVLALCCLFSRTRDLLFVMFPHEVVVLDLELGGLVSRISLSSQHAGFSRLLSVQAERFSAGNAHGDGRSSGVDLLLCMHTDGCMSVWSCYGLKTLQYSLVTMHRMLPEPPRALSGAPLQIMSVISGPWRLAYAEGRSQCSPGLSANIRCVAALPPHRVCRRKSRDAAGEDGVAHPERDSPVDKESCSIDEKEFASTRESLVVMVLTTDCRIWTWDIDWHYTAGKEKIATCPAKATPLVWLPKPSLVSLLSALPRSISSFTVCPTPVAINCLGSEAPQAMVTLAAVTGTGMLDIITLRAGLGGLLFPVVSISLEAHKDVVRGLRWLGNTPRLVSFSCKKEKHGWRNCLIVTDMRSGLSVPFREVGPETSPMLAIRSSPSGRHLLVLFRGAPSEIWVIGGGALPQRVRVLDLPFTSVEWVLPSDAAHAPDTPSKWAKWSYSSSASPQRDASPPSPDPKVGAAPEAREGAHPEERLAFALADGRVGVLAVKGRRIADTQPKRPSWGLLAGSECVGMALAAWGTNVLLGDAEGNLLRWDTSTGRSSSLATGMGPVRKVQVAPSGLMVPRHGGPPLTTDPIARVAVLFTSGQWGVWELDARAGIRPVTVVGASDSDGGGGSRVTDLYWLPLPLAGGNGGVVATSAEDTSLSFLHVEDTTPRQPPSVASSGANTPKSLPSTPATSSLSSSHRLDAALMLERGEGDARTQATTIFPQAQLSTTLLLPRPIVRFLRLLLQLGVPPEVLELGYIQSLLLSEQHASRAGSRTSTPHKVFRGARGDIPARSSAELSQAAQETEAQLWELLPRQCWRLSELLQAHAPPDDAAASRQPPSLASATKCSPAPLAIPPGAESSEITPAPVPGAARPEVIPMSPITPPPRTPSMERSKEGAKSSLRSALLNAYQRQSDDGGVKEKDAAGMTNEGPAPSGAANDAYGLEAAAIGDNSRGVLLLELIGSLLLSRRGSLLSVGQMAAYKAVYTSEQLRVCSPTPMSGDGVRGARRSAGEEAAARLATARKLAARMVLAAEVSGDLDEAMFWSHLVPTLESLTLRRTQPATPPRQIATPERPTAESFEEMEESTMWRLHHAAAAAITAGASSPGSSSVFSPSAPGVGEVSTLVASPPTINTVGPTFWDPIAVVKAAQQRSEWHERIARDAGVGASTSSLSQEILQERQVLQYVTLGDFEGAVGFLLASTPEQTTRYFRNALCTISLAAATSPGNASTSLHMQAAKVVAANTAAMGDTQLGVPLLCSVGLPSEAAALLQDSGLWRHAATLAAAQLSGSELSAILERWAVQVLAVEGGVWRAVGLLTAGGCCHAALRTLKGEGRMDCAAMYLEICRLLGAPIGADGRDSVFTPAPSPFKEPLDVSVDESHAGADSADTTASEFADYISGLLISFQDYM